MRAHTKELHNSDVINKKKLFNLSPYKSYNNYTEVEVVTWAFFQAKTIHSEMTYKLLG